jgi:hypothetical protein
VEYSAWPPILCVSLDALRGTYTSLKGTDSVSSRGLHVTSNYPSICPLTMAEATHKIFVRITISRPNSKTGPNVMFQELIVPRLLSKYWSLYYTKQVFCELLHMTVICDLFTWSKSRNQLSVTHLAEPEDSILILPKIAIGYYPDPDPSPILRKYFHKIYLNVIFPPPVRNSVRPFAKRYLQRYSVSISCLPSTYPHAHPLQPPIFPYRNNTRWKPWQLSRYSD